ncbi:MAG: outer membrane beta-barrel protein [Aureispira sp.]
MMKSYDVVIRYLLLCCLVTLTQVCTLSAQRKKGTSSDNCNLDEAKRWYEEGNLERVESIETCASDPKSMSSEKRLEAFELITESYLYRNKIGAADKSFREMLRIDPLYKPDLTGESQESYDLIYLSQTFNRNPIFSMYFGGGLNFTLVEQMQNYGVDNTSGRSDREGYLRQNVFGVNASIGFELPLLYNFDLTLDATFGYRTYAFGDTLYMSVGSTNPTTQTGDQAHNNDLGTYQGNPVPYSTLTFKENQYWIDIPLMLRYNITKFEGLMPYIYAGVAANFLISADLQDVSRTTTAEPIGLRDQSVPTKQINITNNKTSVANDTLPTMRTMVNVSFVAGAGMKFRVGRNFLYADFRYSRMFLNAVNTDNRYTNPELLYNYGHVDNDFRMDNFALTIGFIKAFYMPRKKRQYDPLIIGKRYNKWLERERNAIKRETDEDLRRELNSTIKDMQLERPSLIEDIQKGRTRGDRYIKDKKRELEDLKNKRVRVEIEYE